MRAVFVYAGALNQPRLSGPTGGNAGCRRKKGGNVMDARAFFGGSALGSQSGIKGRTLPILFSNVVWFQNLKPEILPRLFLVGRGTLRPDVLMVLQIGVKPNRDAAHVGNARGFLSASNHMAGARRYQYYQYSDNKNCSYNLQQAKCLLGNVNSFKYHYTLATVITSRNNTSVSDLHTVQGESIC